MLGADPETAFLLPVFLVAALAGVAAFLGLGWGLRALVRLTRAPAQGAG
jgi:hypothetical protein